MQRLLFCAVAVLALGMSACTSTSSSARNVRADRAEIDYDQVAVVNELSLRRGVDVTWINPPVKRVPAKSGLGN
jgi:hypothetical protein